MKVCSIYEIFYMHYSFIKTLVLLYLTISSLALIFCNSGILASKFVYKPFIKMPTFHKMNNYLRITLITFMFKIFMSANMIRTWFFDNMKVNLKGRRSLFYFVKKVENFLLEYKITLPSCSYSQLFSLFLLQLYWHWVKTNLKNMC